MLELRNIKKSYHLQTYDYLVLDEISLKFGVSGFVSIIGPSGSGKTTLLNIIGGLDRYDSGEMFICDQSTKNYTNSDWDYYRNNCIGFVFQDYNLIQHISVIENVSLALTLSGVNKKERDERAKVLLIKLGLEAHIYKKPNQLSGGQMQRVSIARALINEPKIILADEPTGALDSKTSVEIMNILKEISKERLVIIVTHNNYLAKKYTDRTIEIRDGHIKKDTAPIVENNSDYSFIQNKTAMPMKSALSLSFQNIKTKKGRTLLTAFAGSIGIIGITLILSISNGFNKKIEEFEKNTLYSFPILINEKALEIDFKKENNKKIDEIPDRIIMYDVEKEKSEHQNYISQEYVRYVENINKDYISGITYIRSTNLNIITKKNESFITVQKEPFNFMNLPRGLDNQHSYLSDNYDLLSGKFTNDNREILLALNEENQLDLKTLEALGNIQKKEFEYNELIGQKIHLIMNDDFYQKNGKFFLVNENYEAMIQSEKTITLEIVGIVRPKLNDDSLKNTILNSSVGGILIHDEIYDEVILQNQNSQIVQEQDLVFYNVLNGESIQNMKDKNKVLNFLGANLKPEAISISPKNFEMKDKILNYLDLYNENKNDETRVIYNDLASTVMSLSNGIITAITYILIGLSGISLIVSVIMIGIITFVSVLERTKEIGILKSLGARKKDIARVFNAETLLIGFTSGLIGVTIAALLVIPTNKLLERFTSLPNIAQINIWHIIIMIIISVLITLIGGFIPAKIASEKEPVQALKS